MLILIVLYSDLLKKIVAKIKLKKIRQRNMKYKKIINTNTVYSGVIFYSLRTQCRYAYFDFWVTSVLKCTLLFRNSWGRLMGKYLKQLVFKKMIKRTIYIASKFRNYKYNYKFKINKKKKNNQKKICRSDLIVKRSGTRNNSNTWRWR